MATGKLAKARAAAAQAEKPVSPAERWLGLGLVVVQLALVIAAAVRYRFESPAFQQALPWLGFGVVVHHLLPARHRLLFFAAISLASIFYFLGISPAGFDVRASAVRGGEIVAIGVLLIGLCHLPIPFRPRVAVLLAVGAGLMALRGGALFGGALAPIWPLLGAFFMFRLVLYAHDIEHEKGKPSFVRALAYFFMLPNVFFPLFPVVDWKAFGRSYYNDDAMRIYQRGLHWMARGVLQIVFYRIVYYHFYVDASLIEDGSSLLRHLLANFALYLRVSGQFHMIVGLLLLFGFNLPETNHHYFLAESFTDYWRRVNIYWKDFMVKIFYTPVAFALRDKGDVLPGVVGSAFAFLATWVLHAYQSYWLRGAMSFSLQDTLFWTILGVLVMINTVWEARRGRKRSLSARFDPREAFFAALRTMGVFAVMGVLWSLWSAKSFEQWLSIWQYADAGFFARVAVALVCVGVVKLAVERLSTFEGGLLFGGTPKGARGPVLLRSAVVTVLLPMSILWVLGHPGVHRRVDEKTRFILRSLKSNQPNTADLREIERGYYENLFDAASANAIDSGTPAPADWVDFPEIEFLEKTGDMRFWALAPNQSATINGYRVSTNAFGLRDRAYAAEKPADTYRIAILGSSHVMGWGVHDGETFESLVELWMSDQRPDGKSLEILNFGVGGYSPVCQLGVLREVALDLAPDAIYYIAHEVDGSLAIERLARLVQSKIPLEDEFLRDIVARAGLTPSMSQSAMLRELPPFAEELVRDAYAKIVELAREKGALPVWIYMPRVPERQPDVKQIEKLRSAAKDAGFITFDLTGLYGETDVEDLVMSQWDLHPNAEGHAMMARSVMDAMRSDERLGFGGKAAAP
jgi:D-alanyl-lipoteichoic acid acyltransferase DltB (MBOAT superfamily)